MKILYLTPGCFDKGGISRYSRYQIKALRDLFGAQNVCAFSLLGPDADSFEESFEVARSFGGNSAPQKVAFAAYTLAAAATWRPNVIHTAHVHFAPLARLAARAAGAQTVLNTYGLEVWSGLRDGPRRALERCEVVLSDCHSTADHIESAGLRPPDSVPVIWDCVDLDIFTGGLCPEEVRMRYGLPQPDEFTVMTLGRLAPGAAHKGYDRLIRVFETVAREVPHAILVIAGRGTLRADLEAQAAAAGLSERVVFTGSIHERDLADVYRAASVFSLVSDKGHGRGEGIPLTPLEAMACGAPILVGNQDGSSEAVDRGRNGIVLDPHDLDAHSCALITLARDPSRLAAMRAEAIRVAHERFSYDAFRAKHADLYTTLLGISV